MPRRPKVRDDRKERETTPAAAPAATDPDKVQRFVESLSSEERMLVVLKNELYEGRWEDMVADLRARLEDRPYIFKLAHRITDDLERIRRLEEFERRERVDLGRFVQLDP